MYQQPRMSSTAEARHLQDGKRLPHGLYDGWNGDDHAVDDDEIYLAAVEGFLPREGSEPQEPVAQNFRLCNARNEGIRHDSRLDQQNAQGNLPLGCVVEFARANPPSKHCQKSIASNRSRICYNCTSLLRRLGKQSVAVAGAA